MNESSLACPTMGAQTPVHGLLHVLWFLVLHCQLSILPISHSIPAQSFSGACGRTFGGRRPSCATGLRVLKENNAFDACAYGGPHAFRRAFFEAYKGPNSALQHVDAVRDQGIGHKLRPT